MTDTLFIFILQAAAAVWLWLILISIDVEVITREEARRHIIDTQYRFTASNERDGRS